MIWAILKRLGVNSGVIITILGAFYFIGITPVTDDKTLPRLMFDHYLKEEAALRKSTDLALNKKMDVMYIIDQKKQLINARMKDGDRIKEKCKTQSQAECQINIEQWKMEIDGLEKDLDSFRKLFHENEANLDNALALKI